MSSACYLLDCNYFFSLFIMLGNEKWSVSTQDTAPGGARTYLFGEPVHAADGRVDPVRVPYGEQETADSNYHH